MSMGRSLVYGSAALFAAGAIGWEMSRRHALAEMNRRAEMHDDHEFYLSERDIWESVSEDVEPTLLGNPDGMLEFQREKWALVGEPSAIEKRLGD